MILVRLMGGLGNQMFQYAFGRKMSIIHNTELVLDDTLLLDRTQPNELVTHRDFELNIFELKPYRWATQKEIFLFNGNPNATLLKKITRRIYNIVSPKMLVIQNANEFNHHYLEILNDVCFVGRWQSELYFKDVASQIRNEFALKVPFNIDVNKYDSIINNCDSVCLHIRRGDLVSSAIYSKSIGALDWSYYESALEYIRGRVVEPVFFVFSDDIDWCKKNIALKEKVYFMDEKTAGIKAESHLYLMTKCKHFIIANSTFAWWGAWLSLNENKIVVAPKKWYASTKLNASNIIPNSWIKI